MRAYSSKKYNEPMVGVNCIILISQDGTEEIRVQAPIKYIDNSGNAKIYRPRAILNAIAVPHMEQTS